MAHETRKGGLGRGLAALIPNNNQPGLGHKAASVVFGDGSENREGVRRKNPTSSLNTTEVESTDASSVTTHTGSHATRTNHQAQTTTTTHGADSSAVHTDYSTPIGATYRDIPVGLIAPNRRQPREVFDDEAMAELVHSIKEFGLLQPIVVREVDDGYEIIMGERRWRAATTAGMREIPAIVRETDDGDMLRDALLENIHRVQLNPLEEAAAYQQLLEEFGVTQAQLADRLGRSRPVITNMIRLLALPVSVQRKVAAGVLSAGHARALLAVKAGAVAQEQLAERIIAEGLSVRATEEAVNMLNSSNTTTEIKKKRQQTPQPEYARRGAHTLADVLDTTVSVHMGKKKGKIVVEFAGKDDFERILGILRH